MALTLTPDLLKMMRQRAEQEQVLFNPREVLALLDRIEALEREVERHTTMPPEYDRNGGDR